MNATAPETSRNRFRSAALWLGLVLAGCKLYLVAGDEIVAKVFDDSSYARSAARGVWFDPHLEFVYPQGLPIIASAITALGFPYRLALELLYLGASGLLAGAVGKLVASRWLGLVTFAMLAAHPWAADAFRSFLTEPIVATLATAAVGCTLVLVRRQRLRLADPALWALALLLGLQDLCRTETVLIVAIYVVWCIVLLASRARSGWRERLATVPLLLVPLLTITALRTGVRAANHAHSGVWTTCEQESPGFRALMGALYSIDAEDSFPRAPVTRSSLTRAIDASPTLQTFRAKLLDPNNSSTRAGERMTGIRGEFGPWLNWLIFDNVRGSTSAETEEVRLAAARELEDAMAAGRLPERFAFYPLDPNLRFWVPELPAAFLQNARSIIELPEWQRMDDDNRLSFAASHRGLSSDPLVFDEAANRRTVLLRRRTLVIEGEAISTRGPIEKVTVEDTDGRVYAISDPRLGPALEVPAGVRIPGDPEHAHQRFQLELTAENEWNHKAVFWHDGARIAAIDLLDLGVGQRELASPDGKSTVRVKVWTRRWADVPARMQFRDSVKAAIATHYWLALLGLALLAAVRAAARPDAVRRGVFVILAVVGSAVFLRLSFYAVGVANIGWTEPRYLLAFAPLLVPLTLAGGGLAGILAKWALSGMSGRTKLRIAVLGLLLAVPASLSIFPVKETSPATTTETPAPKTPILFVPSGLEARIDAAQWTVFTIADSQLLVPYEGLCALFDAAVSAAISDGRRLALSAEFLQRLGELSKRAPWIRRFLDEHLPARYRMRKDPGETEAMAPPVWIETRDK